MFLRSKLDKQAEMFMKKETGGSTITWVNRFQKNMSGKSLFFSQKIVMKVFISTPKLSKTKFFDISDDYESVMMPSTT